MPTFRCEDCGHESDRDGDALHGYCARCNAFPEQRARRRREAAAEMAGFTPLVGRVPEGMSAMMARMAAEQGLGGPDRPGDRPGALTAPERLDLIVEMGEALHEALGDLFPAYRRSDAAERGRECIRRLRADIREREAERQRSQEAVRRGAGPW